MANVCHFRSHRNVMDIFFVKMDFLMEHLAIHKKNDNNNSGEKLKTLFWWLIIDTLMAVIAFTEPREKKIGTLNFNILNMNFNLVFTARVNDRNMILYYEIQCFFALFCFFRFCPNHLKTLDFVSQYSIFLDDRCLFNHNFFSFHLLLFY